MDGYLDPTSNHSGGHGSNVGGCHEQGLNCNMATKAAFLSNFSATVVNLGDGVKADSQEVEADIINSHGSLEQQGVLRENEFIAAVDCANQKDLRDEETLNCSVFTAKVGRRGRGSQNLEDPLLGSNEETQKKLSMAVKTSNNSSTSTKAVSSEKVKTELELEMELFEAAEREEKMRLISSSRLEEQGESTFPKGGVPVVQGLKNERKRGLDDTAADVSQVLPRKRGRRAHRVSPTMEEDDVCFVCFDGGELVLCDRRSCPKAYHLSCIGRDAAFFKKKGSWFCGWHFCCGCCRPANLQCYTCPKAYCIGCSKEADFLTFRKRKGLCDDCLPIVKMIESSGTENADGVNVDFDDPDTYECLFKEYWEDLKSKFSLRLPNIRRDGKTLANTGELVEEDNFDMDELSETEMSSGESDEEVEMFDVKEAGGDKNNESESVASRLVDEEQVDGWPMESHETDDVDALGKDTERLLPHEFDGWASKGLLEFLVFMNHDPKISISRFQVNKLLWNYIKSNKLQNRQKRTIIECDERLQKLFGKKSMHQYEMMKDIHLHFPPKGSSAKSTSASRRRASNTRVLEKDLQRDVQPTVDGIQERSDTNSYKDTPKSKREDEASEVSKVDSNEYAAIIPQNISLIYLRRTLLEDLLDDPEFETKVVGTFVRIRVPGTSSKPEMCYRLAQVAGMKVQSQEYKTGKKTTNVVLEIMNLHKKEDLTIDLVSNQDFTVDSAASVCERNWSTWALIHTRRRNRLSVSQLERLVFCSTNARLARRLPTITSALQEECHRLRQSVKCHFIRALRVGEIEQKALSIREAKLNDWFETEVLRLIALRDGANKKGRKKELRECIEKLQKFSDADFRAKELRSLPVVIADPHMNPDYESDGNEEELNNDRGEPSMSRERWLGPGDVETTSRLSIKEKDPAVHSSDRWNVDGTVPNKCEWDALKFQSTGWESWKARDQSIGYSGKEPPNDRQILSSYKVEPSQWEDGKIDGACRPPSEQEQGPALDDQRRIEGSQANWNNDQEGWKGNETCLKGANLLQTFGGYEKMENSGWNINNAVAGCLAPTIQGWAVEHSLTPSSIPPPPNSCFPARVPALVNIPILEIKEKEKLWHYQDPSGAIQGPFSMEQLKKWNLTGLFPLDLRIWKSNEQREESILLTDALAGHFTVNQSHGVAQAGIHGTSTPSYESDLKGAATSFRIDKRDATNGPVVTRYVDGRRENSSFRMAEFGMEAGMSNGRGRGAAPNNWAANPRPSWGIMRGQGLQSFARNQGFRRGAGRTNLVNDSGYYSSGVGWGQQTEPARGSQKVIPCRFHQKGFCRKGDMCLFRHD